MKLVSFSGAQSTGKTTLLKHLHDRNYDQSHIKFIPEVTRLINREYDLPINESAGGLTQLLVNAHHVENIFKIEPNHVTLKVLDRCILDGFVYTCFLTTRHANDLLDDVYRVSRDLCWDLINRYDIIFHTSHKDVELQDDGERSINKDFRDNIIKMFDTFIDFGKEKYNLNNIVTLEGTVEERLKQIDETFKKHGINDVKI